MVYIPERFGKSSYTDNFVRYASVQLRIRVHMHTAYVDSKGSRRRKPRRTPQALYP